MITTDTTVRFGYACINTHLQSLKPRVTCNRSMIKRTFLAKGLPYASEISLKNAQDILAHDTLIISGNQLLVICQ